MEEEAREILRGALSEMLRQVPRLATAIRQRFAALGGVDLPAVNRDAPREPPDLGS